MPGRSTQVREVVAIFGAQDDSTARRGNCASGGLRHSWKARFDRGDCITRISSNCFLNREQGRRETDREEALFKNTQEGRILTCAGSRPQSQVAPSLRSLLAMSMVNIKCAKLCNGRGY